MKRSLFMKRNKTLLFIFAAVVALAACNKEDNLKIVTPVGLGGESFEHTAIDQWILDSLTATYNVDVKYRWDPFELQLDKTLTPPDESKIIPALTALKRVWIEPYNAELGSDVFMKKYTPKQFKLVGSAMYDVDGTVTLGQAEGGNNITLFDINQNFFPDEMQSIMFMIHAVHHEFAHILHQNVIYPTEFIGLSQKAGFMGYTVTWFNISEREAYDNGYITPYAASGVVDDFAETVSVMMMLGKDRFEEVVNLVSPAAQVVFRSKEQIIVNYFKEVWGIDFYSLQRRVNAALNQLAPPPTIEQAYGFGNTFATASVDFNNQSLLPQRASFTLMMQDAAAQVAAIPQFGLTLDSFALVSTAANKMTLRMFIGQNGTAYAADFNYSETISGGAHDYTYIDANDNGVVIKDAVQTVLDYFSNNQFKVTWYTDPSQSIFARAKFTTVAASTDYFLALLLP